MKLCYCEQHADRRVELHEREGTHASKRRILKVKAQCTICGVTATHYVVKGK